MANRKPHTEQTKDKIRAKVVERMANPELRRAISEKLINRTLTEETKDKMSKSKLGVKRKKFSKEHLQHKKEAMLKAVQQMLVNKAWYKNHNELTKYKIGVSLMMRNKNFDKLTNKSRAINRIIQIITNLINENSKTKQI